MKRAMVFTLALTLVLTTLLCGCGERTANGQNMPLATPKVTATLPDPTEKIPEVDEMMPDPEDGVVDDTDGIITEEEVGNTAPGGEKANTKMAKSIRVGNNTMASGKGISTVNKAKR